MIARAFLFATSLFLLYNIALLIHPLRKYFGAQSGWQENVIKAQEYLWANPPKMGAIVGSSLAARLAPTTLETDFDNLSFSADGPLTGLEIIRRKAIRPRLVLIETNMLLRERNENVIDCAFRPVLSDLRPLALGLRERYQPANFIAGAVGAKLVDWSLGAGRHIYPRSHVGAPSSTDKTKVIRDKVMTCAKAENEIIPERAQIERQIDRMKRCVADLEERGARCAFVEMPIDASLAELAQPSLIRSRMLEAFPESKYIWVRPEKNRQYVTLDGMHLPVAEADAYALRIRAQLAQHGLLDH